MKIVRVKNRQLVLSVLAVVSLYGCGGGSDSNTAAPAPIAPPVPTEIAGGTVNSPAQMDSNFAHTISSNDSINYFKIDVDAGNKIVIWTNLDVYLDNEYASLCEFDQNYYLGIQLMNTDSSACANNYEHTFQESVKAVFRFGYPDENSGVFFYSIVADVNNVVALQSSGVGGTPDSPRLINEGGDNQIDVNSLLNYYSYEGQVGETITINAFLNGNYSADEAYYCAFIKGAQTFDSHQSYGIAINDRSYNCDDEITYTFEKDESINLHFKYIKNVFGYFVFSTNK